MRSQMGDLHDRSSCNIHGYFGYSSNGSNEVEMVGSGEVANFKESSGLHLLEIEPPKGSSDGS